MREILQVIKQSRKDAFMARKSKETLLREKLSQISECPFDIFSILEGNEETLNLIKKAEGDDIVAIKSIIRPLYEKSIAEKSYCEALFYMLKRAIALGDLEAAEYTLYYVQAVNCGFILGGRAYRLIEQFADLATKKRLENVILEIKALILIDTSVKHGDYGRILSALSELPKSKFPVEWIYILAMAKKHASKDNTATIMEIAKDSGLEHLLTLPTVSGEDNAPVEQIDRGIALMELGLIDKSLKKHRDGDWRDFWFRCMYEFVERHLGGEMILMAESAITASGWRTYYKDHPLHTLAWCCLWLEKCTEGTEEYTRAFELKKNLIDKCHFAGISTEEVLGEGRDRIMRESVYLSSAEEMWNAKDDSSLGAKIEHARNRYSVKLDLAGHGKRGKMHFWESTMSLPIEKDNGKPPRISKLEIRETNNRVSRGGITLEHDKMTSQVICYSEITVDEIKHPFEIDMILDIAYISAVKCSVGEIKIKSHRIEFGYIVMDIQVFLY